jgi:enoyl-CoA hydratase/carnithine racemase
MPDQYAGEVPALFVVPAPGAVIDGDALRDWLDAHVHEAPARPKCVTIIDALPVTAVGKVFKPALRDLAIKEKVALEVASACGPSASATVEVTLDSRRNTVVEVRVAAAVPGTLVALRDALKPLPQTYIILPAEDDNAAIRLTVNGPIATLTLNRPGALNALSHEVMSALKARLEDLAGLAGLRAVVLTGSGRAFCTGGDLIEFEAALTTGKQALLDLLRFNQDILQTVEDLPVPVIAAVNGVAVAGGLELLLCCDLVIAAESALIGDGHTRYGIVPAGGATVRLMEKLPASRAAQLFYTAALIDVGTLAAWGLVNEVVPGARLMERAHELAREIAERSPEAIRHAKALTRHAARSADRQARIRAELEAFALHIDGQDLSRGLAAFRAKQPPRY